MITTNDEAGLKESRIILHGKLGAGKTMAAATWCSNCPKDLEARTPKDKMIELPALWISGDVNATIGLYAKRLKVHEIKLWQHFAEGETKNHLKLVKEMLDNVYDFVDKEKPELVCLDTATALDKPLLEYLRQYGPKTRAGAVDSFAVHRAITSTYYRLHADLTNLPCKVAFLMHSKPRSDSEGSEKRARAQGTAGKFSDIRFDFYYQDVDTIFGKDVDMIFVVDYTERNGKRDRKLYLDGYGGFTTKNRFQDLVPDVNPVNLNDIYKLIEP